MIESKYQISLAALNDALRATSVPFDGMTPRPVASGETPHFTENGVGFFVVIHFAQGTNAAQRQQLRDILAAHMFTRRQSRSRSAIRQALLDLTTNQRNQVLLEMAVDKILGDPGFAKRLGINMEGYEAAS